ncbi:hypothetical protein RA19_04685 [Leisingera sp. ANG-M1]|uniref:hypothetical protein n=1 Tax=Leisingera sp. ANG-M1 TaxID=1577895 RepID=UPI00057D5143|nr:hypothetical protein [Leisingera sp. ANG-M1]KIC11930.1 hypothetical protein RA19_04685 [Leisingera sp. ANG-M1]
MLTDIYARSMMTAARQDGARTHALPPARPLPSAYAPPPRAKGLLARLADWLLRRPVRNRCIKPQEV